nr:MAG TPA: N-acetylmuramoyl-L-alanine amidase [Caudoviricetes sp.]
MSNSGLVVYTKLSPNHSGQRTHSIDRITPHCVVGQLSCESICGCFTSPQREASCNYGIGTDGRISLCVEEKNRSWCSSSNANDQRAVTIECSSDKTAPYAMTDAVYATLIDLCTDICKRNGKSKLLWFGDKNKTLAYEPKADEMIITVHRWFANKSCPGDWLYNRLGDLAAKVTSRLGGDSQQPSGTLYRVQTGAYKQKANADAQLAKVKAAGFDTYMVQAGGYYKIQVGAYSKKANADAMAAKLKAAGFDTYITTEQGKAVSSSGSAAASLAVGDKVKMASNAPVYGSSKKFSSWVYSSTLYVREISGNRIVISTQKTGAITGAVDKKYLTKI